MLPIPVASFVSVVCLSAPDDAAIEALELGKQVVAERYKISSGIFHVTAKGWTIDGGKRVEYENRVRLVLDGDSLLNDVRKANQGRSFRELRSWGPHVVVYYTDRKTEAGASILASVWDVPTAEKGRTREQLVDPRMIGLKDIGFMMLAGSRPDDFLARQFTKRFTVEDEVLHGRPCRVITQEIVTGAVTRVWIDPERDYSIMLFETENSSEPEPESSTYEVGLKFYTHAGRWFPEVCRRRWVRGGAPITEEEVVVRVERLNQPVDHGVFELTGLDIPRGTGLSVAGNLPGSAQLARWDGRSIEVIKPEPYRPPPQGGQTIWLGLAALLALAAVVVAWKSLAARA